MKGTRYHCQASMGWEGGVSAVARDIDAESACVRYSCFQNECPTLKRAILNSARTNNQVNPKNRWHTFCTPYRVRFLLYHAVSDVRGPRIEKERSEG